jgi:hypothetical protein
LGFARRAAVSAFSVWAIKAGYPQKLLGFERDFRIGLFGVCWPSSGVGIFSLGDQVGVPSKFFANSFQKSDDPLFMAQAVLKL